MSQPYGDNDVESPNQESQHDTGEPGGKQKVASVKCGQPDGVWPITGCSLFVLKFPILGIYYGDSKTILYLYTVIFRSYEGTAITFNYSMNLFGDESVFPLILKDALKIFPTFLGLHSLYLCSALCSRLTSTAATVAPLTCSWIQPMAASGRSCLQLDPAYGGLWQEI